MTPFVTATCQLCNFDFYHESDVIAFHLLSDGDLARPDLGIVSLNGQAPGWGVRCVCKQCVKFFAEKLFDGR